MTGGSNSKHLVECISLAMRQYNSVHADPTAHCHRRSWAGAVLCSENIEQWDL